MFELLLSRLPFFVGFALVLGCVIHIARLPGPPVYSTLDAYRLQCKGDEECAQKLETQRAANFELEIQNRIKEAFADQDKLKRDH